MAETRTREQEQQRANVQAGNASRPSNDQRSLQPGGNPALQHRRTSAGLFGVSPFELMRQLSDEMFRSMLGPSTPSADEAVWAPRIEAFQEGNEFVIRAELPGTNPADIAVDIGDGAVTIGGERRQQHQERRGGVVVSEISYGAFSRVIPLPEGVIADSATAAFRDGVLEIRMPAPPAEVSRGRRIEIEQQAGQGGRPSQSTQGGQSGQSSQDQSSGSKDQSGQGR